jgi:hypothetical protein
MATSASGAAGFSVEKLHFAQKVTVALGRRARVAINRVGVADRRRRTRRRRRPAVGVADRATGCAAGRWLGGRDALGGFEKQRARSLLIILRRLTARAEFRRLMAGGATHFSLFEGPSAEKQRQSLLGRIGRECADRAQSRRLHDRCLRARDHLCADGRFRRRAPCVRRPAAGCHLRRVRRHRSATATRLID